MKASIIIPTFNALAYTKLCLETLRSSTHFPHEIIVVDNGSTDGTREFIKSQKNIKLIETKSNLGYSGACNLGIEATSEKYVVISNNDIAFTPFWLSRLIKTSELNDQIGLVGPITNSAAGQHQQPHKNYHNLIELTQESQRLFRENRGNLIMVSTLIFFCTLIKRTTIEKVGLLDPNLGLGGCDDFDYCFRANMAALDCILDTSVYVHHYCSSTYRGNKFDYWRLSKESIDRYNEKWKGISRIGTSSKV